MTWTLDDDGTLTISGTGAMSYRMSSQIKKVIVSDGVTTIDGWAFCLCDNIPDSVEEFGNGAFGHCSDLERITFPETLKKICERAFEYCKNLTEIKIPASVAEIGKSAFQACSKLENITLSDRIIVIGKSAFEYCQSLKMAFFYGQ